MRRTKKTKTEPKTEPEVKAKNAAIVNRRGLQEVLALFQRVADTGKAYEGKQTSFVHMNTVHDVLRLSVNNMEVAASADIQLHQGSKPFAQDSLLPAKLFYNLVKGAKKNSDDIVGLDVYKHSRTVKSKYMAGEDTITVDVEDMATTFVPEETPDNLPDAFTSVGEVVDKVMLTDFATNSKAMEYVLQAVSSDETRFNLCNMLLNFLDGEVVATDGHRIHFGPILGNDDGIEKRMQRVMAPKSFVDLVIRLLKQAGEEDRAGFVLHKNKVNDDDSVLIFALEGTINWTVICQVPDVEFPDYKQITPSTQSNMFRVERALLEKVCKRMNTIQDNAPDHGAVFELGQNKLTVSNRGAKQMVTEIEVDTERLHQGEVEIVFDENGEEVEHTVYNHKISMNLDYLLEAIAYKDEVVTLSFNHQLEPIRIQVNGDFYAIVMPLRL